MRCLCWRRRGSRAEPKRKRRALFLSNWPPLFFFLRQTSNSLKEGRIFRQDMEFSASSKSLQYRINDHLNLKNGREGAKAAGSIGSSPRPRLKTFEGREACQKNKNKNKSKILARSSLQTPERLEVERGRESELSDAAGLLQQHALVIRARAERIMRMKWVEWRGTEGSFSVISEGLRKAPRARRVKLFSGWDRLSQRVRTTDNRRGFWPWSDERTHGLGRLRVLRQSGIPSCS